MEIMLKPLIPLGLGMIMIGAGLSIAKIAVSSIQSITRQPEYKNDIRATMIISAALIEGIALFAIVVTMILVMK